MKTVFPQTARVVRRRRSQIGKTHNFAVFGNPNLADQTELDGIVRVFDRGAQHAVSGGEHYSLKYSPVVVVDADHLALSSSAGRESGRGFRTGNVLVARPRRIALRP